MINNMSNSVISKKNGPSLSTVLFRVFGSIILLFFAFCQIFPFILKIAESLQPEGFVPSPGVIYLFPESYNFVNYIEAWKRADMGIGIWNSIWYTAVFLVLSGIMVMLCGYVFAKKKFKGKAIVFTLLLSTLMVPGEVIMVQNYILMVNINWIDSPLAIFLPGIVNITGIFLVTQFLKSTPDSLFESIKLDGANEIQTIFYLVTPLALPALSCYIVLTFVAQWNDYLWPYTVLQSADLYTIQLKLMYFSNPIYNSYFDILKAAGLIIATVPIIIIYLIFQKQFTDNMSISGLK